MKWPGNSKIKTWPPPWKNEEFRGGAEKLMDVGLEEMVKLDRADGVRADSFNL